MLYRATHITRYRYDAPVSQCQSEVRLTPRRLPWQTLLESSIRTVPTPVGLETHTDYFGNIVASFDILESHDELTTTAVNLVEVRPGRPEPGPTPAWEAAREAIAEHVSGESLEALECVFDSPFVTTAPELAAFALPKLSCGKAAPRGRARPLASNSP